MSETFTMTLQTKLKEGINLPAYKKWDIVMGMGGRGIVIRINKPTTFLALIATTTYTIHPYKTFNKKWKDRLWFKWFKLRVWIGNLYKS